MLETESAGKHCMICACQRLLSFGCVHYKAAVCTDLLIELGSLSGLFDIHVGALRQSKTPARSLHSSSLHKLPARWTPLHPSLAHIFVRKDTYSAFGQSKRIAAAFSYSWIMTVEISPESVKRVMGFLGRSFGTLMAASTSMSDVSPSPRMLMSGA